MDNKRVGFYSIMGLAIASLGIIAPIGWDLYKSQSAVEVQHLGTAKLVEPSERLDKLEIRYNGELIPSISKTSLAIVNTGRTPIEGRHFTSPIVISFPEGTRLLEVTTDKQNPEDLEFERKVDHANRSISVRFPLLNPKDYLQFSVLLGGATGTYTARARIVGVTQLGVVDRSKESKPGAKGIPWTVYPVGFFAALLILVGLTEGIGDLLKELRVKRAIRKGEYRIPTMQTKKEHIEFVKRELRFLTGNEKRETSLLIDNWSDGESVTDQQRKKLEEAIVLAVRRSTSIWFVLLIVFGLGGWGIWYVASNVLP